MTISRNLPSGNSMNQELTYDALRVLEFLKSSTAWINKLPIDKDARPVLERAWTHYCFRTSRATSRVFLEWLIALRDKTFRVRTRQLRFTETHFDFLLRKLMSYTDHCLETLAPMGVDKPKQPQQPLPTKKTQPRVVESEKVASTTTPTVASKPKKTKVKKNKSRKMDVDATPPSPERTTDPPVQSKIQKRKHIRFSSEEDLHAEKLPRSLSPPRAEEIATEVAPDSDSVTAVPSRDEEQTKQRDPDALSVMTPSTWRTLRDDPNCYGDQRLRRAIARTYFCGRKCCCSQFTMCTQNPHILHNICDQIASGLNLDLFDVFQEDRNGFVSAIATNVQNIDALDCRVCNVAVGTGLGIAIWAFGPG